MRLFRNTSQVHTMTLLLIGLASQACNSLVRMNGEDIGRSIQTAQENETGPQEALTAFDLQDSQGKNDRGIPLETVPNDAEETSVPHAGIPMATDGNKTRQQKKAVLEQLLKAMKKTPTEALHDKIATIVEEYPSLAPQAIETLLHIDGKSRPFLGDNYVVALIKELVKIYPERATFEALKPGLSSIHVSTVANAYAGIVEMQKLNSTNADKNIYIRYYSDSYVQNYLSPKCRWIDLIRLLWNDKLAVSPGFF